MGFGMDQFVTNVEEDSLQEIAQQFVQLTTVRMILQCAMGMDSVGTVNLGMVSAIAGVNLKLIPLEKM
jgi:hypothetical protein